MANDSTTDGYLRPIEGTQIITEPNLVRLLQQWVVGITGLDGNLVRPRWQVNPPPMPTVGTDWVGMGITQRRNDGFAAIVHDGNADQGTGRDSVIRHQELELSCSFYGPNADDVVEQFVQGMQVEQNRWALKAQAACNLVAASEPLRVPELHKGQWLNRVDVTVTLRRALRHSYGVRNITGVDQNLAVDE